MFLFGNKFYIIFISLWIIGLYFVVTTFPFTSNHDKTSADRIKYLQNEVASLQQRIFEIQSKNMEQLESANRCQELNDELKRVKRQLKEKDSRTTTPPRRDMRNNSFVDFYLICR